MGISFDRRSFITALAAAVPGLILDPERLLWVPGQKTFFIPPELKPPVGLAFRKNAFQLSMSGPFEVGDIFTISGEKGEFRVKEVNGANMLMLDRIPPRVDLPFTLDGAR